MHERRIIYEVYNPQRCMGPYLNKSDADKAIVEIKKWATREGTLKDFAPTVREAEVECEIRAGEILGVLDGSETCHLVFQKPCGEWSSEDVDEKTAYADEFILHCSCRKCIDKYFIVRPPRRSPPSSDSLA